MNSQISIFNLSLWMLANSVKGREKIFSDTVPASIYAFKSNLFPQNIFVSLSLSLSLSLKYIYIAHLSGCKREAAAERAAFQVLLQDFDNAGHRVSRSCVCVLLLCLSEVMACNKALATPMHVFGSNTACSLLLEVWWVAFPLIWSTISSLSLNERN